MKTYLNRSVSLGNGNVVKRHITERNGDSTIVVNKQKVKVFCPGQKEDPKAVWGVK